MKPDRSTPIPSSIGRLPVKHCKVQQSRLLVTAHMKLSQKHLLVLHLPDKVRRGQSDSHDKTNDQTQDRNGKEMTERYLL